MRLQVDLKNNSYAIEIGENLLEKAGNFLNLKRKVMIVTDDGVPAIYAKTIAEQCQEAYCYTFKSGEDSKSLATYSAILTKLVEYGFKRQDALVAVGGGVCGDLGGFVAASYMRGIDFYNIPTTTLAQIDSSIGGKTGVNFAGYKNLVGAFYQPKAVLIDLNTLKTLDQRQFNSGLIEALKMGLTSDEELFSLFESPDYDKNLLKIIVSSLTVKKQVVERDEKELGLRKILNFGHTIGHGIEVNSDLYHGEAVALGILGMCSERIRERLIPIYKRLNMPCEIDLSLEKVYEAIKHDKKRSQNGIDAVVVEQVGSCKIVNMKLAEIKDRCKVAIKEQ